MTEPEDEDPEYVETTGSSDWAARLDGVSGTPYWREYQGIGRPWSLPSNGHRRRRRTRVAVIVVAVLLLVIMAGGPVIALF